MCINPFIPVFLRLLLRVRPSFRELRIPFIPGFLGEFSVRGEWVSARASSTDTVRRRPVNLYIAVFSIEWGMRLRSSRAVIVTRSDVWRCDR